MVHLLTRAPVKHLRIARTAVTSLGLCFVFLGLFHVGMVRAEYTHEIEAVAATQADVKQNRETIKDLQRDAALANQTLADHQRRIVALEALRLDARLTVIEYIGYATVGLLLTIIGTFGAWFVQNLIRQVITKSDE